ncbi:MAG: MFS transporter, partial [Polyangiales bacterium]
MTPAPSRRIHYAFVVVGVVFLVLLVGAGMRGAPGVLLQPLERYFGWTRSQTSRSAAVGIFFYGMVGPFAAAVMQTLGIRRVVLSALLLMAAATGVSVWMTEPWHMLATWGVLSGIASGCVAIVFGATIVNRWFVTRRGLMMGLLTASTATGSLIFIPGLAMLVERYGWQVVVLTIAGCALALIPLVWAFMVERPSDVGLLPFGATEPLPAVKPATRPFHTALGVLARASRQRDFWLLFATFFICGATTNGLVGTHMIALCGDNGIPEVRAASVLAAMGLFDLIGTTGSGWLTDRYDARRLLCMYYGLRGLSLIWLPRSD